ncbi:MAG: hypothetical protein ACOZB3_08790 [Calditrichota bacterium]
MTRLMKWQRGAADLMSVAIGMVILSITVAGTAGAMIYGREAMIRQEHAKAAAYILRGRMEEVIGQMQTITDTRDPNATRSFLTTVKTYPPEPIDLQDDRGGNVEVVYVTVTRDRARIIDPQVKGSGYYVTLRARWRERSMAEAFRAHGIGMDRELTFTTAVVVRAEL